jgi:hypothetical protein
MSKFVLHNVRLFAGGVDLTGNTNKIEIECQVEDKETTNFASIDASGKAWKEVIGGLASTRLAAGGQWEALDSTKVDDDAWSNLGAVDNWSAIPNAAASGAPAAGDLAYLTKVLRHKYHVGGSIGDVATWEAEANGTTKAVRGSVLHPPGTARTSTGSGTAVQIGAVSAAQALYAGLHVYSIAGTSSPTITVKIQSDDNSGFTSPTDRVTFTAATAVGGQWGTVAGAVTDDWWRATWTISGTSPSFLLVVTAGIA